MTLKAESLTLAETEDTVVVALPSGMSVSYSVMRTERLTAHHESISPELMMVGMQQAKAQAEIARSTFEVPAQEHTRQVRWIGGTVIGVVLLGVVGAVVRPEAATQIAGMVGVVSAVFGGVYYVKEKQRALPHAER